jgi:LmbE family N-acetylglucosaminyl deacetylase
LPSPTERVVVVSPHLDDAALSLGAAIASWGRQGAAVELLTVLAGDPDSDASSGGWDRRGGFATEAEATRGRRSEDARACAELGATPSWLSFGDGQYERHGTDTDVRAAVSDVVGDADMLLLPGWPLSHPDHEWLVRTVADASLGARRLGFYVEQPYAARAGGLPGTAPWLEVGLGARLEFATVRVGLRDRRAKRRALQAYASQLPLLALNRRALLRLVLQPERIAWVGERGPDAALGSRR